MIRRFAFIFIIFFLGEAKAVISLNPKIEYFQSQELSLPRLLVKSTANGSWKSFSIYVDAFAEADFSTESQRNLRRAETSSAYLQELWIEYKRKDIFLRVGRQAQRWSESWTLPSLDVFTGRKFERLFFDPLSESLTHSTGVSASWAGVVDVFFVTENATTTLPKPLPKKLDESLINEPGGGIRLQGSWLGFNAKAIYSKVRKDEQTGLNLNYATDFFVPKIELGSVKQDPANRGRPFVSYFTTAGIDFFWEEISLLPQLVQYEDTTQSYLNLTYTAGKWNSQLQIFRGFTTKTDFQDDLFASILVNYNWSSSLTLVLLAQNYEGKPGSLYSIYRDLTRGAVFGTRLDWNFSW